MCKCNPLPARATHFLLVQPTFCTCKPLSARANHFLLVQPTSCTCNPLSARATHFLHVLPTFCTCNPLSARATHFLTCNRKYRHGGTLTRYCTLHHPNVSSNSPYCTCHPRHLFVHAARTTISILHVLRAAAAQATHKTAGSSLAGAGCALPYDRYESLNCVHGATITG